MQSLNLGGSNNIQSPAPIRRINRLPIAVVIVLLVVFLGIIFYGLASRGLYFGRTEALTRARAIRLYLCRPAQARCHGRHHRRATAAETTFQPTPP